MSFESKPNLSRSKSVTKMFRRAKNWLEVENTPLTFSSTSNTSSSTFNSPTSPIQKLSRSATTYVKASDRPKPRPTQPLRTVSSQSNNKLLYLAPDFQISKEQKELEDLLKLRNTFDGLEREIVEGKEDIRRKSWILVQESPQTYQVKRKPVSRESSESSSSETDNDHRKVDTTVKSKRLQEKRIPRKAPPIYYLDEPQVIDINLPLSNSDSISPSYIVETPSTPELKSSRSSISSIESYASASSQSHSPPGRPVRSPSRSKFTNAVKINTSRDGMLSFGGRLSPVQPSPMEEVRTFEDVEQEEFEMKSGNQSFLPSTPRRSSSKREGGMWFV